MSIETQVNVEKLMQEISHRARRSSMSSSAPTQTPDFSRLEAAAGTLETARSAIGQLPPTPQTLRGRIGSALVVAVRRMLFWYTPPIAGFAAAVQENLKEHTSGVLILSRRISEIGQTAEAARSALAGLESDAIRMHEAAEVWRTEFAGRLEELRGLLESGAARMHDDARAQRTEFAARLEELKGQLQAFDQMLQPKEAQQKELALSLQLLEQRMQTIEQAVQRVQQPGPGVAAAEERMRAMERELHRSKAIAAAQECRISVLFEELRRRMPEGSPAVDAGRLRSEEEHWLDTLYCDFEDVVRGSREDIRERARVYLAYLSCTGAAGAVLDLGCGRGEWLELLRSEGIPARGVDRNRLMVARCRELGLDVAEADMLAHLSSVADNSLGAVTGLHIVEHLPHDTLVRLLDEIVRVLRPGGVAIFETPNPANTLVGSRNFYLDPTHRNPLPSELLAFLAEARGLCRIELLPLHPYPESARVSAEYGELAERFNEFFFGPQDYAVIGFKA